MYSADLNVKPRTKGIAKEQWHAPGLIVANDEAGPLAVGIVLDLAAAGVAGAPHSQLLAQIPLVKPRLRFCVARAAGFL